MEGLSAHADWREMLDWLGQMPGMPQQTFITHGEPVAADSLRQKIERHLGWDVVVPEHGEEVDLGA